MQLVRLFFEEEVRAAIKGLNAEGALGSDGLLMFFYVKFWELVGPEVMATLNEFWPGVVNIE